MEYVQKISNMATLRHTGITISSLGEPLIFYQTLGFKILTHSVESGKIIDKFSSIKGICVKIIKLIDEKGGMIELLYYISHLCRNKLNLKRQIIQIGISHIAFTVDNLDELYKKLKKQGIKFNYPVQISEDGKVKIAFCRDPDGNLCELVEEL